MEIFDFLKGRAEPSAAGGSENDPALAKGAVLLARVLEAPATGQVQLRIGSRLLNAVMSQYVEPGTDVRVEVAETSPRLLLRILPQPLQAEETPSAPSEATRSEAAARPSLVARVLDFPAPDRIRLRVVVPPSAPEADPRSERASWPPQLPAGREITARLVSTDQSPVPRVGQEVRFSVVEASPRLVLQTTGPTSSSRPPLLQAITGYLGQPGATAAALAEALACLPEQELVRQLPAPVQLRLTQLADLIRAASPEAGDVRADFPVRLLQLMGLNGERSPMREAVARLWSELVREPSMEDWRREPALKGLMDGVLRLHDAVERLQALNQQTGRMDQTVLVSFPLFWPGGGGRGEMAFKPDQAGQAGEDRAFRVTLLLDLTRLGRLKADIQVKARTVGGTILTASDSARQAVQSRLNELIGAVEAHGLTLSGLAVRSVPEQSPLPETLAAEIGTAGDGLINIKV